VPGELALSEIELALLRLNGVLGLLLGLELCGVPVRVAELLSGVPVRVVFPGVAGAECRGCLQCPASSQHASLEVFVAESEPGRDARCTDEVLLFCESLRALALR